MQIPGLAEILRKNPIFSELSEESLKSLEGRFAPLSFALGETVVERGGPGDGLYVIYSGKARVVDDSQSGEPVTLAVLNRGDIFGEQALLHGTPRAHTVRAAGELIALKLSNLDFEQLTRDQPSLRNALQDRIRRNTELNFLRRLGILSHLKLPEIQGLLKGIERLSLRADDVLFSEGDAGDRAYIIREGQLRISKQSNGKLRQLAVAKPGDLVGEMSLLHGHPRSATATAVGDVEVMALSQEVFHRVTGEATAREAVIQQATDRILQAESLLAEPEPEATPERIREKPKLTFSIVEIGEGIFRRSVSVASTEEPKLAGLACLAMAQAHLHVSTPTDQEVDLQLRQARTETLLTLSRRAEDSGLMTRLLQLDPGELQQVAYPAVVEMADGALAVLVSVSRHRVVVADPLAGVQTLPREQFLRDWTGRILTISAIPQASFEKISPTAVIRQFLPFAAPFLSLVIWICVITLVVSLLGVASPLFSKTIVDKVLVSGDQSLLYMLLLGMLIVTAFEAMASTLRDYLIAHTMRRISGLLQLRFFHHILSLPQKISSSWGAADFLVRFAENDKILRLVSETGVKVVVDSVSVVVYAALMFSTNVDLALPAVGFIFAYGALMFWASPRLRAAERKTFEARKNTESQIIETVTGIQTVKALALEDHTLDRGNALIAEQKVNEFKAAKLSFSIGQVSTLLQQAATVVVLGYGAMLALNQKITTGELVAFNALLGIALAPLMSLVNTWDQLQELRIAFDRTGDVLKLETEQNPKTAVSPAIQGHVSLKDVAFRYPGSAGDVLSGVNLEALPGQKIALVGRSGSGKTSLANLLIGLYQPTAGSVLIDHVDVDNIHKYALRRQVGIVEQQPFLFSGTIRENIAKADPAASLDSVVAAATLAGAHEFIEELPLAYDTPIGERGVTLSGGQRQRLVIARALLNNPRILVLDEATSALDTESERIIQRNMERILEGKTAFIIAHRLSTVRNADRIVVLDQGRIVESGTHAELIEQRGLYAYLNSASN